MSSLESDGLENKRKKTMFGGSEKRQQMLRVESLQTIVFSLQALQKSLMHPYVLKQLRMCLKPIAMTAAGVYVAGMTLLIPFAVLAFLMKIISLGYIDYHWMMTLGKSWVRESVALVPFLAILAMKSFLKRPLHSCFIRVLQQINPQEAARIEAKDPMKDAAGVGGEAARLRSRTALRILRKAGFLLVADAVLGHAQKGHFLGSKLTGRVLVALSHFYTMKKVLGRDRAVMLAFLGVVPYLEPWILKFIQIWRASNLLGQELLSDYLKFCIPSSGHSAFLKSHDVDIPLFALPGNLLLLIPIIGPLFFVPLQASTAFLVDRFVRETNHDFSSSEIEHAPSLAPSLPTELRDKRK